MALPNLIIAGAPKCGTSSLFQWIADHPAAEGSSVKETCYFADPTSHVFNPAANFAEGGLAGYEAFFPVDAPDAAVRLEATPTYIYQETALERLPDLPSEPRFLFVLREPASQMLSTYRYFSNNWTILKAGVSFAEFVERARARDESLAGNELLQDAFANVVYVDHLERWRERVGDARMRVMLLDDFVSARGQTMADLAAWLGLDPTFYETYGYPRENETYRVKSRLLQEVNVRVRGLVAKTPLYEGARALYRRLNTEKQPEALSDRDQAALAALPAEFSAANQRLAERFDLDLSAWTAAPARDAA